jgi:hypothetical protein
MLQGHTECRHVGGLDAIMSLCDAICYGGLSCRTGGEIAWCFVVVLVNYCCLFLFLCHCRRMVLVKMHLKLLATSWVLHRA